MSAETYILLADLIGIFHAMIIVFMMTAVFVAPTLPKKIEILYLTIAIIAGVIAITGFLTGYGCPITVFEFYLRSLGGQESYIGSFITYYLEALFSLSLNNVWKCLIDFVIGAVLFAILVSGFVGLSRQKQKS